MANVQASTGLLKADGQRYHFDVYAILEGPQEMYFGHEVAVNVNLVETVKIAVAPGEEIEKCYLSPTKRRGVERRTLIWAPLDSGLLLGDKLGCGIPHTCGRLACPICSVYGALIPKKTTVDLFEGTEDRDPITFIGRLTHGGGVAVQEQDPSEKQRAMHPSSLHKDPGAAPTPVPFKREYDEPGLLYPVYNHALSLTDDEFAAVAYAFLQSIARIGAGNPKGVKLYEGLVLPEQSGPMLVVDRYLAPLGKRPIVSPLITDIGQALAQFSAAARVIYGKERVEPHATEGDFERWIGDGALVKLQEYAANFVGKVLKEQKAG